MAENPQQPKTPQVIKGDERYYGIIHDAVDVCKRYKPKFGKGKKGGLSLEEFQMLYRQDPFYTWFGLDSPLLYAAHKAAGGITSVYRQIGMGCERVFRQLLQDSLGLTGEEAGWSYDVPAPGGLTRTLTLDGRIPISCVRDNDKARLVSDWLMRAASSIGVDETVRANLKGPVFEVRQGYKSKDSKRQNADVGNASNAYAHSYLPVVVLLSSQIDSDIAERYARAQWVMLTGTLGGSALTSTYVFTKEILGYDLAAFFQRNSDRLKQEIEMVLTKLLSDD